jgi:hypothetical protein
VSVYWIEFEGQNGDHMVNYAMKIGTEKAVGYRTLSQLARLLDRNLGVRGFVFYHFQGIVLSIIGIILAIGLCFALGFDHKEANALVPVLAAIIGYSLVKHYQT